MIQSCCHMPPYVTPLSQSLAIPRSHLTSRKRFKQQVIYLKGRNVCQSSMPCPTLRLRPVQSQFSIRCHHPLWPKPSVKILCWDWSFHTSIRGLNQRARLLQKLDAKQHENTCCNLIDWCWNKVCLHHIYISNDVETHQLVPPLIISRNCTLHAAWWLQSSGIGLDFGSSEREILLEYNEPWCNWICHQLPLVSCCKWSLHRSAYTHQGSLVANIPLHLLCSDFLKVDPSRDSKENILVLTDAFTKFSQAFITNNQKALTIAKILVEKWFYVYGILACIHSTKGQSFENALISKLYSMYNIKQSMTTPYNLHGNSICEQFNHTLLGLLQSLPKEHKELLAFACSIFGVCL